MSRSNARTGAENVDKVTRIDAGATSNARIPFMVGVVGHNDPAVAAKGALEDALRNIFELVYSRYESSPVEVLSSLAEGADQIVADVALEKGCLVRAPLPFPPDVYVQSTSFQSEEAREHFRSLLYDPRVSWFVVPLPAGERDHQQGWAGLLNGPQNRNTCYANAGGYIVRHCLVLIALWDGELGGTSGTEEMVRFRYEGTVPSLYPCASLCVPAAPPGRSWRSTRHERGVIISASPKPVGSTSSCRLQESSCADSSGNTGLALALVLPARLWNAGRSVRKQEPQ